MNNKNIISNKFDLNWSTTFSYKILQIRNWTDIVVSQCLGQTKELERAC
jgi:hypothetical protein